MVGRAGRLRGEGALLAGTEAALFAQADHDDPVGREATHRGDAELLVSLAGEFLLGDELGETAAEGAIERLERAEASRLGVRRSRRGAALLALARRGACRR